MGDAIACCLVKARGFREMDFAQFHPGGMLGKRLLTKASDVMHTQDLPVVTPATPLPEAVTIVSQGRLGICIAVDDDRICGIITDGDIRRAMQHSQSNFFTLKVGDVMTHNPKTVPPTMKIVEIDNILNRNKIHCVLVADADRHLLGVVDSFSTVI